jgi:hypothetical protein
MRYVVTKDTSGKGSWFLIVGCPLEQAHVLRDSERNISGPSFAICANCEYQTGVHLEDRDPDADWSAQVYPERLKCGYMMAGRS